MGFTSIILVSGTQFKPASIQEVKTMFRSLESTFGCMFRSFILFGSGWKRRTCRLYQETFDEWQDPESGVWHIEGAALRIVKVRSLEQYQA